MFQGGPGGVTEIRSVTGSTSGESTAREGERKGEEGAERSRGRNGVRAEGGRKDETKQNITIHDKKHFICQRKNFTLQQNMSINIVETVDTVTHLQ